MIGLLSLASHCRTRLSHWLCMPIAVMFLSAAFAQDESRKIETQSSTNFEQLELDSIAFVQEHHADLVRLLKSLKVMRQKEYEVAIREINRTKRRLESLTKREPELHQLELDAWKIKSQIDLLMAKGIAHDKSFDKESLRELIKIQLENQKKRWQHEQSSLAKRQEQLADLVSKLEGHEEERMEQQLASHLKSMDLKMGKAKKPKQDAKPNNANKE
jgi:hypothetical protein